MCNPVWSSGYDRWMRERDPETGRFRAGDEEPAECRIPECREPQNSKELCKSHYDRLLRYGDPLYRGRHRIDPRIQLDPEEAYLLEESHWSITRRGRNLYARRSVRTPGTTEYKRQYLHHAVVGKPPKGMQTDHRNQDGLDNRRVNLRWATPAQNQANKRKMVKTEYKGVQRTPTGRWRAMIVTEGDAKHLGTYDDPQSAARAYDRAAVAYWGEFAEVNFPIT